MTAVQVSSVENTVVVTGDANTRVVTVATAGPQGAAATVAALEARVAALEAVDYLVLQDGN